METKIENLFIVAWGLSGGFGGARNFTVEEHESMEEAEQSAFELACDEYESYAGSNGLRTIDEIMDDDNCDESEAEEVYNEERETWLDYFAVPYSKEAEKKYQNYHYENRYKSITG